MLESHPAAISDRRAAVFSDTWTHLKCGGAPKKINLIAEDYCRRNGARDKVDFRFFSASDRMFEVPLFRQRLEQIYAERNIPVAFSHRLKAVDTGARKLRSRSKGTWLREPISNG